MLRLKSLSLKFKFLEVSPRVEVRTLQWLFGFFVFALIMTFVSEHLSGFLRQFSFQIFLGIALVSLLASGWRPHLHVGVSALKWTGIVLISYFFVLQLLDWSALLGGFEGLLEDWHHRSDWLLLAVVAPVIEEIFFRDALLRSLYQRMGRIDLSIVFSSAFFMVAHLTPYPGAFLLGVGCSVIYLISKSLWPAIVFHSLSNLSLIFIPALFPNLSALMRDWGLLPVFYR